MNPYVSRFRNKYIDMISSCDIKNKKRRNDLMNYLKSTNLDDVFYGAGSALNTMYTAANVISDGWNSIKNCMDSRRNMPPCNYGYGYGCGCGGYNYGGYMQPVPYGYGYADYGYPAGMTPQPSFGYGPNPYMNNGYFGFTDPGYGAVADPSFCNGGNTLGMAPNPNGPQGGAWGL